MFKFAFALVVGIAIGYFYGFDDARKHAENVVTRVVAEVGGSNRDRYSNDIDKRMDNLEKR
ncbi:MAG TPA: hypothetical protein VL308_23765 [Gemmatimonadaceae bacterium]|jgi:hypothetical protein|nr:hypothetical protein [Gemmatimonadaceae bacterium]